VCVCVFVCVCVCVGIHRDVLMYSKPAECHIIDYEISTELHAPPLLPVARHDAHLTRDVHAQGSPVHLFFLLFTSIKAASIGTLP
jgi:hypothetical protein